MPIYQNCTSGHWKNGHDQSPLLGLVVHYVTAAWGCGFFVFQVLCSDSVRFMLFLKGEPIKSLFTRFGVVSPGVHSFHPFDYHGGLVAMWVVYLVLLSGGFNPFYFSLQVTTKKKPDDEQRRGRRNNCSERQQGFEAKKMTVSTLSLICALSTHEHFTKQGRHRSGVSKCYDDSCSELGCSLISETRKRNPRFS